MGRGCIFVSVLLAALFVSSCTTMSKREQEENILSMPSARDSVATALATGEFQEGQWPDKEWWHIFGSVELDRLIQETLASNPTLSAIGQRVEVAKQNAIITRSKLFPLIFFDASETYMHLSKNGLYHSLNDNIGLNDNLMDLSLGFAWELDFWGKNKNLYLASIGQEMADAAEAAQVQLIVTTGLSQLYYALKANLERKGLYERLVAVRSERALLENLLQEHALLSKLPTQLAEERVEEAAQLLFAITEEIATNYHEINALRGEGPDATVALDQHPLLPPKQHVIPETLSAQLLCRRPDLMAAKWRIESQLHSVNAAIADFYPRINLNALAGFESVAIRKIFEAASGTAALMPTLHLPIFTAGAIRANVNKQKAAYQEAVFNFNDLLLRSVKEVTDALVVLDSVIKQKSSQTLVLESANVRLNLTDLNYRSGLDSRLSVLMLEEEVIEKALDEVALIYTQYATQIKLIKSLGGGYHCE